MNDKTITEEFSVSITWDRETGLKLSETWQDVVGEVQRKDIDHASIGCFDCKTGVEAKTIWLHDGEMHREGDKPAIIHRNPNTGRPWKLGWYVNGRPWREDPNKPVHIYYDWDSGDIKSMDYRVGRKLVNRCPT